MKQVRPRRRRHCCRPLLVLLRAVVIIALLSNTLWMFVSVSTPSVDRGGWGGHDIPSDAVSSGRRQRPQTKGPHVQRYWDLEEQISKNRGVLVRKHVSESAFNRATVVNTSQPWFTPRKICMESCCAETVAISLNQDDHQIINTLDGLDLADVIVAHYGNPRHIKHHANILDERMLPCLQPGTIIHLENHRKVLHYFFNKVRQNITVPFLLITSESDADSPDPRFPFGDRIDTDDLMMKWYGANPNLDPPRSKFVPFPLGLSKHHHQDKYFARYLSLTNYSNPFADKRRWTSRLGDLSHNDLFVKFGINEFSQRRRVILDSLCKGRNSMDGISCGSKLAEPSEVYAAASKYLFGVSPPGAGYDCYRTYELLLLGVIPIIESRPSSVQLFEDLPVVPIRNMFDSSKKARQNFLDAIRNYIDSDAFQHGAFVGWERLFLEYWRRKILKDAGRDREILTDGEGREYYQAWRYTPQNGEGIYCSTKGNCECQRKGQSDVC